MESVSEETTYYMARSDSRQPDSIKRPQVNSFLRQQTYTCSFGPEDYRSCLPEALTQKERPKNSRVGSRDNGVNEADITKWMDALLEKLRLEDPEWMCSCIMVDDAIAEINAIRAVFGPYGVRVFLCFWHVKRSWLKNLHRTYEWVRGFWDVPHAQQDTTGACEGYHSAIKGNELAKKSRLQGRRVDWLLYLLWTEVDMRIRYKQAYKNAGFKTNRKSEGVLTDVVIAAQAIPNSFVELVGSSGTALHAQGRHSPSLQGP
ncbi:hypothetical protein WJX79_007464 [Trebouxia sp. C0005]